MFSILSEPFSLYRSFLLHQVKRGQKETIVWIIKEELIQRCLKENNYLYALYTLSLLDYLCCNNNLPICEDFDDLRELQMKDPYYVGSPQLLGFPVQKKENCIPEFLSHNIYEVTIYDAC